MTGDPRAVQRTRTPSVYVDVRENGESEVAV